VKEALLRQSLLLTPNHQNKEEIMKSLFASLAFLALLPNVASAQAFKLTVEVFESEGQTQSLRLEAKDIPAQIWSKAHSGHLILDTLQSDLDRYSYEVTNPNALQKSFESWQMTVRASTPLKLVLRPKAEWPQFLREADSVFGAYQGISGRAWDRPRDLPALEVQSEDGSMLSDAQFAGISSYFLCVGSHLTPSEIEWPRFLLDLRSFGEVCTKERANALENLSFRISEKSFAQTQKDGADLHYLRADWFAARICPDAAALPLETEGKIMKDLAIAKWIRNDSTVIDYREQCLDTFHHKILPALLSHFVANAQSRYGELPAEVQEGLDRVVARVESDASPAERPSLQELVDKHLFSSPLVLPAAFDKVRDLKIADLVLPIKSVSDVAKAVVKPRFAATGFSKHVDSLDDREKDVLYAQLGKLLTHRCKDGKVDERCVKDSVANFVTFEVIQKTGEGQESRGFGLGTVDLASIREGQKP
jgi:hypothetical protein